MKPTVSVIVPVFGAEHYLDRLLATFAETTSADVELVLVDNRGIGSSDLHLRLYSNPIQMHVNVTNLGFARACNQGAQMATGDTLVFLNVDTEPQAGWLPPLVQALDLPSVGIAGSRLVYPDGRLQHAGVDIWHGERLMPSNRQVERDTGELVDAVTGACMAVRAHVFNALGRFDEVYWNGGEDVDLCLTAHSLGFGIWYEPASIVVHHESATGPERWTHVGHNLQRLANKWSSSVDR